MAWGGCYLNRNEQQSSWASAAYPPGIFESSGDQQTPWYPPVHRGLLQGQIFPVYPPMRGGRGTVSGILQRWWESSRKFVRCSIITGLRRRLKKIWPAGRVVPSEQDAFEGEPETQRSCDASVPDACLAAELAVVLERLSDLLQCQTAFRAEIDSLRSGILQLKKEKEESEARSRRKMDLLQKEMERLHRDRAELMRLILEGARTGGARKNTVRGVSRPSAGGQGPSKENILGWRVRRSRSASRSFFC